MLEMKFLRTNKEQSTCPKEVTLEADGAKMATDIVEFITVCSTTHISPPHTVLYRLNWHRIQIKKSEYGDDEQDEKRGTLIRPSADRGISSLQWPWCKTVSSWRDNGDGIHINFDKRKEKKLTTFKILAVSGPRIMCFAFHLVCNCWKSRVAMVYPPVLNTPLLGTCSFLPGIKHIRL